MDLMPTHSCYDDSVEMLISMRKQLGPTDSVLVQGIRGNDEKILGHSWVENSGMVWDAGFLDGKKVMIAAVKEEYYTKTAIIKTWSYTYEEALLCNSITGHLGPWRLELLRLCGDYSPALEKRLKDGLELVKHIGIPWKKN